MVASEYAVLLVGPYRREQRVSSMMFFIDALERGLKERRIPVETIYPEVRFGGLSAAITLISKLLAAVDKLVLFPWVLRRRVRNMQKKGTVVVHVVDQAYANYTYCLKGIPHVVTCHDVISLQATEGELAEHKEPLRTRLYQRMLQRSLAKAPCVVSITQTTKDHLLRLTGRDSVSTPVVYDGLHYPYRPMDAAEARTVLAGKWTNPPDDVGACFMHIGINIWYKNRMGVLDIFREWSVRYPDPPMHLLMIGPPPTEEMKARVREWGMEPVVHWVSGLSNEEVRAAYSLAQALIFPSFLEGFGWPLIEAMACGCPVFVSNRLPMTEVGADAARYFDPSEPANAVQVLAEGMADRGGMVERGLKRAELFTADHMLSGYLAAYEQALEMMK